MPSEMAMVMAMDLNMYRQTYKPDLAHNSCYQRSPSTESLGSHNRGRLHIHLFVRR